MSNINEEQLFVEAGLNTDDAWEYQANGDAPYRLQILKGEDGQSGMITNMKGNHLASYPLDQSNVYIVLGSYYNVTTRKAYYFVFSQPYDYSGSDDYIYDNHLLCFNEDTEEITNIFTDEVNYFGLHYDYPVRDCDMIGDYLYFNPRISEPKMIDVVRAYNYTHTDEYDPLETYVYGERVRFHGGVFMANAAVAAGETPATDTDLWDRVGDSYKEDTDINFGYDSEFRYAFNVIRHIPIPRPICAYGSDTDRNQNNLRGKMLRFAYRYKYFDNTYSKFGMYSDVTLPPFDEYYNGEVPDDVTLNNYIGIRVSLHSSALIKEIDIIFQEIGQDWKRAKIINRWEQEMLDDGEYTYNFYNTNTAYEVIDDELLEEVYDAVPPMAAAQELINKNVLTYAGCLEGFDPIPKDKIDVVLEPELQTYEVLTAEVLVRRDNMADVTYEDSGYPLYETTHALIDLDGSVADGVTVGDQYRININGRVELYPVNADDDDSDEDLASGIATFITLTYSDYPASPDGTIVRIEKAEGMPTPLILESRFYSTGATAAEITKKTGFKTGAWHPFSLFYYDAALRRWDAQTSKENEAESGWAVNGTSVYVPVFNEYSPVPEGTNYKWNIAWEVYHRPPDGAKWWRWGYAGNSLTSSFVQYVVAKIDDSVTPEPANTIYFDITPLQTIQTTEEALWNQLPQSNISSYEWAKGDRVRIITEAADGSMGDLLDGIYDYEIIKQDIVDDTHRIYISDDFDFTALGAGIGTLIEIYRPKDMEGVTIIPFYEFGPIMPVNEDDNGELTHGGQTQDQDYDLGFPATGVFENGDVYHIMRTPSYPINFTESYFHESGWYSDFYDSDDWNRGRQGLETSFRRKRLNIIRYSDQYLQDTEINGLSTFGGDNYKEVTDIYGEIRAIMEVGTTLKVYMQKKSASIGIGRQEWLDADGSPTLSTSAVVLGAVRYPENNYGTEWLESVFKNNRFVYGFDIYNAIMWRDSANGLFPISGRYADAEGGSGDYKMSSWFKEKSKELLLSGIENVRVLTTWDERYKLLYVTFRDKVRIANNDTIVFHEPSNRWITFAELEQTPVDGWNEMLELTYDIVHGFEGGLDIYFDEDTRFTVFNIGSGLGTTPGRNIQTDLLELTIEALEPTIYIDSSLTMDLLGLSIEALEPVGYISFIEATDTWLWWDYNEYSVEFAQYSDITGTESSCTINGIPLWLSVQSDGNILSNGRVLTLPLTQLTFFPITFNSEEARVVYITLTDSRGNIVTITVIQSSQ